MPTKEKRGPVHVAREGNVTVPVYQHDDGRYWVVYRELGETNRTRRPKIDLATAKRFAKTTAIRLANAEVSISAVQREQILHVEKIVAPFGVSPTAAIEQWAEWRRQQTTAAAKRILIPQLVAMLIATKLPLKLSARRMREFYWLRDNFAKTFTCYIDEVRAVAPKGELSLESYYSGRGVEDRRYNNIRDVVVTLFLYAKEHGYLPADKITEAEKVKRIELDHEAPKIYTPAQVGVIVEHVSPDWIDATCCQAFLGVRPEEATKEHISRKTGVGRKLMWTDFMWDERQLRIVAQISKTGRDRYVSLNDTFLAWCGHHRGETGPVCKLDRWDRETGRLAKLIGFPWINDGLRHCYATYWNSVYHNMAKLKEEMGNSEQVNRRYYFHPQPAAIAKRYWLMRPSVDGANKITQMPLGMHFG